MKEIRKRIIENYVRSYNQFDIDGMIQYLHGNVVFENILGGKINLTTRGINAFREQALTAKEYFAQRKQTI